jgi:heterodisulfide reductase subunit A-like polyferredoxin
VAEYAKSLPCVAHSENNLYTCSQDTVKHITEQVKELGLNRVVVASCTPLTHEPLFQSALRTAGLNPYLFEMANIRNQCSWVHSNDRESATDKAKDLVRMATARAARLEQLHTTEMPVEKAALVIGGGVAGMNAALSLAEQGFPVHLVERTGQLGGNLRNVFFMIDASGKMPEAKGKTQGAGLDPQIYLDELIGKVTRHPLITVHLQTEIVKTGGFVGNFSSKLQDADGKTVQIQHGATIVATGGREYRGKEYGYGQDPRIVTGQEFEALLAKQSGQGEGLPMSAVFIQCIGPAEKYCARTCCATALKNALKLKELNPAAQVTILYKDLRTFGFKERLYTQAREHGILFIRYDDAHKPQISNTQSQISLKIWEPMLDREMTLTPDMLVLSNPTVPAEGAHELATRLKVPVDMDGFFLEAHVKLRPVDFASEGLFMAGLAHYPKFLDESIIQAQAAAARAASILAQDTRTSNARVAVVDADKCVGCLTCVRTCPFDVPQIKADLRGVGGIVGAAFIEPVACQGCGSCVSECPAKAIQLMHYTDAQLLIKVDALFGKARQPDLIPVESIQVQ